MLTIVLSISIATGKYALQIQGDKEKAGSGSEVRCTSADQCIRWNNFNPNKKKKRKKNGLISK